MSLESYDTDEEALMWKSDMYSLAMRRMTGCQTWGNTLLGNCLPACLCILPKIKERFPHAFVALGDLYKDGDVHESTTSLQDFVSGRSSAKPSFHAWVDLDSSDIFDPVGPSWVGSNGTYFDRQLASEHGIRYHQILADEASVTAFYNRLLALQLGG